MSLATIEGAPMRTMTVLLLIFSLFAFTPPVAADPFTLKDKVVKKLTAADPPADDDRLVAGWRAGPLFLGMNTAQLLAAMGDPDKTHAYGYHYSWGGTYVQTLESGKVTSISVGWNNSSSAMKTAEGLGIGSSQIAVVTALGQPDGRSFSMGVLYFCYARGFIFEFDNNARTTQISIVTKARAEWVCEHK
jgi:hypothetical protein